jgi:hypothetical protein
MGWLRKLFGLEQIFGAYGGVSVTERQKNEDVQTLRGAMDVADRTRAQHDVMRRRRMWGVDGAQEYLSDLYSIINGMEGEDDSRD